MLDVDTSISSIFSLFFHASPSLHLFSFQCISPLLHIFSSPPSLLFLLLPLPPCLVKKGKEIRLTHSSKKAIFFPTPPTHIYILLCIFPIFFRCRHAYIVTPPTHTHTLPQSFSTDMLSTGAPQGRQYFFIPPTHTQTLPRSLFVTERPHLRPHYVLSPPPPHCLLLPLPPPAPSACVYVAASEK